MDLSERLRKARRVAGMSQQALARALGVTRSAVSNWESVNPAHPATANMALLADALQVSFEWIATGRGDMRPPRAAHATPAPDALLVVDCPHERNLLSAYRHAPLRVKALLQEIASLHAAPARESGPARRAGPAAVRGGHG